MIFRFSHLILLFTMTFAFNYAAQGSEKTINKKSLDPILAQMKEKYRGIKVITAKFNQTVKSATLRKAKDSTGRIYIKRPNLFRWETLEPDPSILTTNGIRFWYYTPPFQDGEKGQVTIKPAKDVPSRLAVDLLSGQIDLSEMFKPTRLSDGHYRLKPLKNAGDIKEIEVFIESQTKLVYKIRLLTKSGNDTLIVLENIELDPQLDESLFSFQTPKNTEVIE